MDENDSKMNEPDTYPTKLTYSYPTIPFHVPIQGNDHIYHTNGSLKKNSSSRPSGWGYVVSPDSAGTLSILLHMLRRFC